MPTPALTPTYAIAVVTTVVSLFLTQGLIDNGVAKLVTGLASVLIPLGFTVAESILKGHQVQAKARLAAAQVQATPPAADPVPPVVAAPVKP